MLRALLLGVLVVSAGASCKSKSDSPAVAVGVAAGKVVEIHGKVDATREGKTRALVLGAEIYSDDQIATSADATVTIELFHNGAKWAVVSNKTARVDASLAWGLDKQAAAKAIEHNSAAAGRNAERSAADTASTTAMKDDPKPGAADADESAPEPVAAAPMSPASGSPPPPVAKPPSAPSGGKGAAPPPRMDSPRGQRTFAEDEAPKNMPARDVPAAEKAAVVITPQKLAERQRPAFQKCLDANAPKITITLAVRDSKTTVALSGSGNITDKVRSCVDAIAQKIEWPVKAASFEVVLKFD